MQLTKLIVCLLALMTKICFARLSIGRSKSNESLVEAAIDVLESCYMDRLSDLGLAGPSGGSILKEVLSRNIVLPAILIDETSKVDEHGPFDRGSRYKLQAFVLTASDQSTLSKTITQVKNSKWWNHLATFFLITWPDVENGCSNAYEILWEAWKMNLLKTNLMCFHRTRGRLIYTFNPYTNKAPFPWQQENTYKGMNGHVWTLFFREYREDKSLCHALNFDKTSDLGGYENRAVIFPRDWLFADSNVKLSISERVANINAHLLMNSLNATWEVPSLIDVTAMLEKIENGSTDICFNTMPTVLFWKYEMTDLNLPTSLAVVTQYPGYKTQLQKLISVLDRRSRLCVIAVLTITLLFFKFYLRKPTIPAILNLVLVLSNAALRKLPDKGAARIYLGSLFIFVVTIQGIYQGQLASLLTRNVRLPSVNSFEDLEKSDHTIYGESSFRYYFNESGLKGRWGNSEGINCTDYVLRDSKAACMSERLVLISEAANFQLHLTREPIDTVYLTYIIRQDWPLVERVNAIHGRVAASGIAKRRHTIELNRVLNILETFENSDQDRKFRVLSLGDLTFAFVILAIGLGCATISFIIEVAFFGISIAKLRSRIRRWVEFIR